jgi:site-specific recombinase XerD
MTTRASGTGIESTGKTVAAARTDETGAQTALYSKEGIADALGGEILLLSAPRPLSQNPAAVYLASLAPGSRRTMRAALDTIARLLTNGRTADALALDWAKVRFSHTAAVRSLLAERYAAATANKMLSALRGTLKAAWRLELVEAAEYQRAVDIGGVTGESLPAGRSLSAGEIVALMNACLADRLKDGSRNPLGVRDAAILSLLYGCGLRRAEVAALTLTDYQTQAEEGGGISPTATLRVRGKRNKQRLVPLVGGAAAAISDWLALRGAEEGPLFTPFRKGGKPWRRVGEAASENIAEGTADEAAGPEGTDRSSADGQPRMAAMSSLTGATGLTTQAIYLMLQGRAREAGVAPFSPHDFRRTFVGDLLDRGADIVTVQKLAGHASVTTTARYDRRGEAAKRKAAELLHVPYPLDATDRLNRR